MRVLNLEKIMCVESGFPLTPDRDFLNRSQAGWINQGFL